MFGHSQAVAMAYRRRSKLPLQLVCSVPRSWRHFQTELKFNAHHLHGSNRSALIRRSFETQVLRRFPVET
jgi:hypothetical protein